MKLVGLRTGSAKNNYYGIGAKVEVRAGSLYQSQVVTGPDIAPATRSRVEATGARVRVAPCREGRIDLASLMNTLGAEGKM